MRFNYDEQKYLKRLSRYNWWSAYYDQEKKRYRRCYRASHSKPLKIQSNRKVRRFKNEIRNGNSYRRLFDYWWNYDWLIKDLCLKF